MPARARQVIAATTAGLVAAGAAAVVAPAAGAAPLAQVFHRTATLPAFLNNDDAAAEAVAEISTVTEDGLTVVYTDAAGEQIGFVDITDPYAPLPAGTFPVAGEPTSVQAVGAYLLIAVDTSESFTDPSGQLVVLDAATRAELRVIELGGQPDSIALSADGAYAAIAIENQRDEEVDDGALPQLPAGFLSILDIAGAVDDWSVRTVDLTGLDGVYEPTDPEPEYVSINSLNQVAVTLQENNAVAQVDMVSGTVTSSFSTGAVTLEGVDAVEDGEISLTDTLVDIPREPDSIGWVGDDLLATANEGDLLGGSRGWSIFDAATGDVVWDAGTSFEYTAVRHGLYPEGRSDAKGAEPEGLMVATYDGVPHVFVGSERGNFVSVYDVTDPTAPALVQVLPSTNGPEGLLAIPSRGLLVVSSEEDAPEDDVRATVQIYELGDGPAAFPYIVSADTAAGTPLPWGTLSALAADPAGGGLLRSVTDSAYSPSRILTIDTTQTPALVIDELALTEDGAPVGLDGEGLFARPDGGYWLAAEGETGPENELVRLDDLGTVVERIALPGDIAAALGSNGLEGVTAVADATGAEQVWVAVQRELTIDPVGVVRLGRYDVDAGTWAWVGYPLDTPPSEDAWVGLSEVVAIDGDSLAVIERDNQVGLEAAIKRVYWFDVPAEIGDDMPIVTKTLAADLLPALQAGNGWTQEKVEGLTIDTNGLVWAVTDNDAVEDATGETVFWSVGDAAELFAGAYDPTPSPSATETPTETPTATATPTDPGVPTPTTTLPNTGGGQSATLTAAALGLLVAGALTVLLARRRLGRG